MQPIQRGNIRLAATVMLIRDGLDGLEVYMVKRPGGEVFPDLHVFPGGKVDAEDFAPEVCHGIDDPIASSQLGLAVGGLRYWVAVARECFEECGVLLARHKSTGDLVNVELPEIAGPLSAAREALLANAQTFAQVCSALDITVACDLLGYFSHWITPEVAPKRFDTRFFLAAMPASQVTRADTDETASEHWIAPHRALDKFNRGAWQMIDPTLRSLEMLSAYPTVERALCAVQANDHTFEVTPDLVQQGMQPFP